MTSVCAVVPIYDHELAVGPTTASLREWGLNVILVDDGSGPACVEELRRIAAADSSVHLIRLARKPGKGRGGHGGSAGCCTRRVHPCFLQIDADGQHDSSDVPEFVAAAIAEPGALVCGRPLFDASIPRHRLHLRYLTHVMVWLNTLSFDIPDSMCGLRVYPLSIVLLASWPIRQADAWIST